jgi:tetratricopeptide (TPR) repeat protein
MQVATRPTISATPAVLPLTSPQQAAELEATMSQLPKVAAPALTPAAPTVVDTTPTAPAAAPIAPAVRPLTRLGTSTTTTAQPPMGFASDAPGEKIGIAGDGTLDDGLPDTEAPADAAASSDAMPSIAGARNIAPAAAAPTVQTPPIQTPVVQTPSAAPVQAPPSDMPAIVGASPPAVPMPMREAAPRTAPAVAPEIMPLSEPETLPQAIVGAVGAADDLQTVDAVGTVDPTNTQPLALEPVDFNGVLLGETTLPEVLQAWGNPLNRSGTGDNIRLSYQIDPFAGVEVTFVAGKASAVVVDLGDMFPPADVAKELSLDMADAVAVLDPAGKELGLVFPERGVSMRYEDEAAEPRVAQIGLDQVTARPFVMRAERRRTDQPTAALVDLATALKLNPEEARAHWLRSRILAAAGRPKEALAAVETALKLDAKAAEYILSRAGLLADQGLFAAALKDNETVLAGTQKLPHYQARAWKQRGDLLADGPEADAEAALDAHSRAIRLAESIIEDPTASIRRDAKQTLIEAHLAVAEDIAWGEFQAKEAAAGRWLAKAESLAKQAVMEDGLSPYVILEVYERGLAACVGTPGCVDPLDWAERLQRTTTAALKDCQDPLMRRQIQFNAGLGLYDALQALHARGDIDNALRFGHQAVEMIQAGRLGRDETPTDAYRFGRLYFRIGSLYAVTKNDHKQACEWFDRAAPLLETPLPDSAAADRGRQGETLVSMGISYWNVGKRDRGLHLTDVGSRYMQRAVSEGMLNPTAMGVAYSNLAVMHDGLGDQTTGRRFHEMAARAETPTLRDGGTLRR